MQPLLQCSLCMWFWLCLFMWRGTKARLKGRAKTIKACPYQLVRPEETGQTQAWIRRAPPPTHPNPTPLWAPTLNTAPSTNQTVRGSGLRLGFNTRLKHETTVLFSGMGEWRLLGVFCTSLSRPAY
ncbi:hypothetical protein PFLUV_G00120990 [Perca fluviatilis]|uniref:Secreted protein n=1 Tax=Perca fluviatilis TaxID=8168 RepID=A0A6A5E6N7_PERFL|nr:hypothetical protein PFLUV_G00120990 [Perca fluviatilis]